MPVRDQLRALPADAFVALGNRDTAIVRRYYGLEEDWKFHTQDELAEEFELNQTTIGTIVGKALGDLLPSTRMETVGSQHPRPKSSM
jgi:hypothetical protein